jgi:hypothetical protein
MIMDILTKSIKGTNLLLADKIMKNIYSLLLIGIIVFLISPACKQNAKESGSNNLSGKSDTTSPSNSENNGSMVLLADTITYDAIISNPNPDDMYTEHFLKHLKKDILVDGIFDAIYSGKMKAYNIFDNKEMTIAEVKEIENAKGFSRSKVGKLQFSERWYLDEKSFSIKKKLFAMAFGYEHRDSDGIVTDYKAMFRVYIK